MLRRTGIADTAIGERWSALLEFAGAALLLLTGRTLDALALGERRAESLGIDVRRTRRLALFGTALGVGAATAVTGAAGLVGLVAPHLLDVATGLPPQAGAVSLDGSPLSAIPRRELATRREDLPRAHTDSAALRETAARLAETLDRGASGTQKSNGGHAARQDHRRRSCALTPNMLSKT